jgi:hypothetical protein
MRLQAIRSQLAQLKATLPAPKGETPVMIFAQKYDPENPPAVDLNSWEPDPNNPGKSRHPLPYDGVETPTHWPYKNRLELEVLRQRFKVEYEDTRGPNDPPCIFVHLESSEEVFESQYRGTALDPLFHEAQS